MYNKISLFNLLGIATIFDKLCTESIAIYICSSTYRNDGEIQATDMSMHVNTFLVDYIPGNLITII